MAKKKNNQDINLLPQEEFDTSTFGRTLRWLLTTFRYIVIGTEMIVMIAFLSRFWLDAKSSELTNRINEQKGVITSYSTFEQKFRSTQNKLQTFAEFSKNSTKVSPVLDEISSKIPSDVTLTEISINTESVQISGQTTNESSLSVFINGLNSSDKLDSTTITSIDSKPTDSKISFVINTLVKERTSNAGQL